MTLLGYIGNTAVYDKRLVSEKVKARVPLRLKEMHLEGGTPCLVLEPHKAMHGGMSWLLYDGLHFEGGVPQLEHGGGEYKPNAAIKFVHFYETGTGLHVVPRTCWHEDPRQLADLSKIRQHKCHAYGCKRDVAPKYLMCRFHWNMVPKGIQDAVWQTYQPGQELGEKQPTQVYLEAAELACVTVNRIEAIERAERAKRDEEFAARKREREEKQLRKKGGKAAKAMFPSMELRTGGETT